MWQPHAAIALLLYALLTKVDNGGDNTSQYHKIRFECDWFCWCLSTLN